MVPATKITDEVRWNLLQIKAQERRAVQAVELFRKNGIEPILIKGVAAAQFYPPSKLRASIDVDLAVSAADYPSAYDLSRSLAADGMAIDLHRELRHLETAAWDDLFRRSVLLRLDGENVRILGPEDNLRVLCVHWLTDGGAIKDRLWDVYYAVKNRPPNFDWDKFLGPVSKRRRRWMICTVGLAHKYLDLDIRDTPIAEQALDLPGWLIVTVEREWASETRNWPLEASLNDPKMLFAQLRKRMRPNPIWATVQMEGSFDAKTRVHYQFANAIRRVVPSIQRITEALRLSSK